MAKNKIIDLFTQRSTYLYVFLIVPLFLVPLVISGYPLYIIFYLGIWVMLVMSLNLVLGYMGYPSMCQAIFYGLGGYTIALTSIGLGFSPWVGFLLAPIVTGAIAFLISIPLLKIREIHFAIGSLVVGLIVWGLFVNLRDITGGTAGLSGVFYLIDSDIFYVYLVLILNIALIFIIKKLVNSHWGNILIAIRENEDLATHCGINATWYKRITFTISAMIAGVAGAIFISYSGYITSGYFTFAVSFFMLVALIIGGVGTLLGPIVGAIIIIVVPEVLRPLLTIKPFIFGVILLLFIFFAPDGIVGRIKWIVRRGVS